MRPWWTYVCKVIDTVANTICKKKVPIAMWHEKLKRTRALLPRELFMVDMPTGGCG